MANLIIVSGPSASGKSTLSHRLAVDLHMPLLSRDLIKEAMFDTLGYADRQRSKELGIASALILIRQAADILSSGTSCIVEAKFNPKFSEEELQQLIQDTGANTIQIQCSCDGDALLKRFQQRSLSADRHPGHGDTTNVEEFKEELLAGKLPYLQLTGKLVEYDTTTADEAAYQTLLGEIESCLNNPEINR